MVKNNEEAVSPVIGVILMVAVTVILAAVIAAYMFGSNENVQKTKVLAATASLQSTGDIIVIYQGGQDERSLGYITITSPNAEIFYTSNEDGTLTECPVAGCDSVTDQKKPEIGAIMKLSSASDWPPDGQKHVIAVGNFNDGAKQVILDTYV